MRISKESLSITSDNISDKIGFIYPVYFGGIPYMVRKFIENLEISKDVYIFAVATFGSGAGVSFNQIDSILNRKGTALSASFSLTMPGNYQVMYSPLADEKQERLFKNSDEEILKIVDSVKRNEIKNSNKAGGIKKVAFRFIYNTFKPKDKDKNFWTTEKCNGCGICSKICPANDINIVNGKPKWEHRCEFCLACMQWCLQKSIQYKKATLKRGRYHHPKIKVSELFQK